MSLFTGIDEVRGVKKPFYVVVDGVNKAKKLHKDLIDAEAEMSASITRLAKDKKQYPVKILFVQEHKTGFVK